MTIDEALDRLLEFAGSDLLLSCGSKARIRKDGNLELLEGEDSKVLQPSDTQRMMRDVLDVKQWRELERKRHVDFSFTWREKARIRGNAYFQRNSIAEIGRASCRERGDRLEGEGCGRNEKRKMRENV